MRLVDVLFANERKFDFMLRPILRSNTAPSNEELRREEGSLITVVAGVILSALIVISTAWNLIYNDDARIFLTTSDTFNDWQALRRVYDQAYNYSRELNPASLSSNNFEPWVDGSAEIDDLFNRRVFSNTTHVEGKKNFALYQPFLTLELQRKILKNLMFVSWCSHPNARVNTTPATRSPGCMCIAQTYLDFMNETQYKVSAGVDLINTSKVVRDKYSEQVLRCFDKRQVSRTSTCGKMCSVHTLGLALYANSVFLLASWTFLQFSEYWRTFLRGFGSFVQSLMLKLLVVGLGIGLCVPFIITDFRANILTISGVVISVVYLTISLHDELNFPAMDVRKEHSGREYKGSSRKPHPLTVVLLMHLQLILPAYGVIIATVGYARDVWAVISFAVTLGLMGMSMQRFFWAYWCNDKDDNVVNQTVLTGIFACLWILLVLLFSAYYYEGSLYAQGSLWVFIIFAIYLFLMQMLLVADRVVSTFEEKSFYWSIYQQGMYLLTLGLNLFFGLVALWDTLHHEVTYPQLR